MRYRGAKVEKKSKRGRGGETYGGKVGEGVEAKKDTCELTKAQERRDQLDLLKGKNQGVVIEAGESGGRTCERRRLTVGKCMPLAR